MAINKTATAYGSLSKFFHWVIATLIIALLIVGWVMSSLGDDAAIKFTLYAYHKQFGLLVFCLALLRILWTLKVGHPPLNNIAWWERLLAKLSHLFLYCAMVFMPLSGWMMSTASGYLPKVFGVAIAMPGIPENKAVASFAHTVHEILPWLIVIVLLGHVVGALKHHFIDKNDILLRMMPGRRS